MLATVSPERVRTRDFTGLSDELERGRILFFPEAPLPLPSAQDQAFLREELASHLSRKNVSYHPEADRVVGLERDPALAERCRVLLKEHGREVERFLSAALPTLVPGWTVGTASFRPMEERGRDLSPHASNELVHVDAGAYGATGGDRILRFFVNLNPTEDRVWATKGTFLELLRRYGREAGVTPAARRLDKGPLDRLRTRVVAGLSSAGVPLARALDSSPYDRAMRRFHNFMKDSPAFQASEEGHREFRFPPFSAWMVFTDGVSHACLSGRHAFADTFLIPLANCRFPELTPYRLLEDGAAG